MPFPLITPRLSISPLEERDLDAFVSYRQDPKIARYQSWETTYSMLQAQQLLESQRGMSIPGTDQWVQLGVRSRDSGLILGDLAVHTRNENQTAFELGFTFAKDNQGHGFATEAISSLMAFLFAEYRATKLIAHTDRRNIKSIALLLRVGFSKDESKSLEEEFKGERVVVDYFEKTN